MREAQVDGDAAPLLFLQAVRVDARERLHQRGLAVIDMAGRADDDMLHDSAELQYGMCSYPSYSAVRGATVHAIKESELPKGPAEGGSFA